MTRDIGVDEMQQIEQMFRLVGFDESEYSVRHTGDSAMIQFEDLHEGRFGEFLELLADECYSFEVDSGFEIPPQVEVVNRSEVIA